jgi:hypothetical protein
MLPIGIPQQLTQISQQQQRARNQAKMHCDTGIHQIDQESHDNQENRANPDIEEEWLDPEPGNIDIISTVVVPTAIVVFIAAISILHEQNPFSLNVKLHKIAATSITPNRCPYDAAHRCSVAVLQKQSETYRWK